MLFWRTVFALLTPYRPKKSKFSKSGKNIRRYHFTKINDIYMMYGSSDMECTGQNVLLFWTIFCPFDSLTTEKIKILKKWKKSLEISSSYISVQKLMIRWCTVPEIWCITDVIVISHFGLFFVVLTPLTARKIKILKKWKKKAWRYHYFTYVYQELWSDDVWFLRYNVWQM